jgi:hypothetical protein
VREIKIAVERPQPVKLRSCKYLNNAIERDHRDVKACTGPVLGFKRFKTAVIAIAGIEVVRRIYEHQFDFFRLRIKASRHQGIKASRQSCVGCLQYGLDCIANFRRPISLLGFRWSLLQSLSEHVLLIETLPIGWCMFHLRTVTEECESHSNVHADSFRAFDIVIGAGILHKRDPVLDLGIIALV